MLGELIDHIFSREHSIAPIIMGTVFLKCLPKAPKPVIVSIPPKVGPFNSPLTAYS